MAFQHHAHYIWDDSLSSSYVSHRKSCFQSDKEKFKQY